MNETTLSALLTEYDELYDEARRLHSQPQTPEVVARRKTIDARQDEIVRLTD